MSAEHKIKVLMLDDEKFLLDIYRIAFEKKGFEVVAFHEADDALKALRAGYTPEVMLFDITMPDSRSGYEFIDTVHHEKLCPRALKVALSNVGQEVALNRLAELGTDGHLLKANYIPSELVAEVTNMLEARKLLHGIV